MTLVRQIGIEDFAFIQQLAGEERSFTVPSDYILWMLSRLYPETCLVATDSRRTPVGYLLGLVKDTTLFIWQLAITDRGSQTGASNVLLKEVKRVAQAGGFSEICFTMQPRIAKLWGFRAAKEVFGVFPENDGPGINGEPHYRIALR